MTARYDGTQFTINPDQIATSNVGELVAEHGQVLYQVAKSLYPAQSYTPGEVIATAEDEAEVLDGLTVRFQNAVEWVRTVLTSPTTFILPIPGSTAELVTVFNEASPNGPFPHWAEFLDLLAVVERVPEFGADLGLLGFGIHLSDTKQV